MSLGTPLARVTLAAAPNTAARLRPVISDVRNAARATGIDVREDDAIPAGELAVIAAAWA